MSAEPDNILSMDGATEEPEPDILREPVSVELLVPITVDGVTYDELTFDFAGRIEGADVEKFRKLYNSLYPDKWNPNPMDKPEYQELFMMKAGNYPLTVFRAIKNGSDWQAVYGVAFEYLGKSLDKKKRKKARKG